MVQTSVLHIPLKAGLLLGLIFVYCYITIRNTAKLIINIACTGKMSQIKNDYAKVY